MKDSIFPFGFKLMIHTCQMLSNAPGNDYSLKEANNKPYIIKPRARLVINGHLFPLNINKVYDVEIDNLEDFLVLIDIVREDLNVTEWVFNRVDFAFDTKLKYNDIFKYNLYIICLLSDVTGIKNAIDIQDVNTKEKRALTLKSSSFEFQIYDKALESKNKYCCTRFEFRFKNISSNKDIYSVIDRLKKLIGNLTESIQNVENQRINDLYSLWKKGQQAGHTKQIKNFSEFVRRYNNDIFTRNIAKGLYYRICKGNFENWLKWFRRNNCVKFITKSEIEEIVEEMEFALNLYIKNG